MNLYVHFKNQKTCIASAGRKGPGNEVERRSTYVTEHQAPVVQRLDNANHRINRYPADKC